MTLTSYQAPLSRWKIWLLAARPKTLPAAVAPVLVGSALALQAGGFRPLPALLCLAFALLIQIGANYANDYFDFCQGADGPDRMGPSRAVASGWVTPPAMLWATILVLVLAFLVGVNLVLYSGWWLVGVGVICILCALAYTGGPYPLGYNGLGDLFVFVFFGPVAVMLTVYLQTGELGWGAWWAGAACGLLAANILVINNYRDAAGDARVGKRTLVVRYGRRFARLQYFYSWLIAMAAPVLIGLAGAGPWVLIACLSLPLAFRLNARLLHAQTRNDFQDLLAGSARLLLVYALLLSLGLFLGR